VGERGNNRLLKKNLTKKEGKGEKKEERVGRIFLPLGGELLTIQGHTPTKREVRWGGGKGAGDEEGKRGGPKVRNPHVLPLTGILTFDVKTSSENP